jgi:hypothetical protein
MKNISVYFIGIALLTMALVYAGFNAYTLCLGLIIAGLLFVIARLLNFTAFVLYKTNSEVKAVYEETATFVKGVEELLKHAERNQK